MTLLVIIDVVGGTNSGSSVLGLDWAYWPMAGWGFFVVLDGLNTYVLAMAPMRSGGPPPQTSLSAQPIDAIAPAR